MPFFIEMLTLVHEWKLSPLFGNEGQPQICEKKTIASTETNIVARIPGLYIYCSGMINCRKWA